VRMLWEIHQVAGAQQWPKTPPGKYVGKTSCLFRGVLCGQLTVGNTSTLPRWRCEFTLLRGSRYGKQVRLVHASAGNTFRSQQPVGKRSCLLGKHQARMGNTSSSKQSHCGKHINFRTLWEKGQLLQYHTRQLMASGLSITLNSSRPSS